jgi:hypothetical protein
VLAALTHAALQFFNGSRNIEERFSQRSRCFTFTNDGEQQDEAVCLEAECLATGIRISVPGTSSPLLCPFGNKVRTLRAAPCIALGAPARVPSCALVCEQYISRAQSMGVHTGTSSQGMSGADVCGSDSWQQHGHVQHRVPDRPASLPHPRARAGLPHRVLWHERPLPPARARRAL